MPGYVRYTRKPDIVFLYLSIKLRNVIKKFRVAQAYRTFAEQNTLYAKGRTTGKKGKVVTNAKGGQSNHNYGLAVDIYEIKGSGINWGNDYSDAIKVGDALKLEWGGRWKKFVDKPHFQLNTNKSTQQLLKLYKSGKTFIYNGNTYVEI